MRQIIIDCARRQQAQKRGGRAEKITLDASVLYEKAATVESLELEDALTQISTMAPELTRLVELRIYAGLSVKECAEVLGVSTRTVDRLWFQARALLRMILTEDENL
jgi:RNA polymerase sigma factor (TIGR02999 family)